MHARIEIPYNEYIQMKDDLVYLSNEVHFKNQEVEKLENLNKEATSLLEEIVNSSTFSLIFKCQELKERIGQFLKKQNIIRKDK
jgi:hypothetical protein